MIDATLAQPPRPTGRLDRLDRMVLKYEQGLAIAIVVAGFGLRLALAVPSYLNPDEILHVVIAGDTTFADSLARAAFYLSPHPFLYNLLLHLLNLLHASEPLLRLPSVIAGALVSLFSYLWLKRVSGPVAGLVAAAVIAFLPDTVRLAAQVREYALLMMFLAAALWLVEVGIDRKQACPVLGSGALLLAAMATHYATFWFMPGYAVYVILRLRATAAPRRLWIAFASILAAFALGFGLAWSTHIRTLMGRKQSEAADNWLRACYFQPGTDRLWVFPFRQTFQVFGYLFSGTIAGTVGLVLTLAGGVVMAWRRRWALLILLMLPFVANCGASLVRLYPYGGMRHLAYLTPYTAAAIGILLAALTRRRLLPALLAAGLLLVGVNVRPTWPVDHIPQKAQRRAVLNDALEQVRSITPAGGTIFFDFETGLFMRWYFGTKRTLMPVLAGDSRFHEWSASGYRLVQANPDFVYWSLNPERLGEVAGVLFDSYEFGPGDTVTVFDAGWGWNLVDGLMGLYGIEYPATRQSARNVTMFRLPAGREPGELRTAAALGRLAERVEPPGGLPVRSVFWPSDHEADLAHTARLGARVLTYDDLRSEVWGKDRRLEEFLPAVAFWVFGNHELKVAPLQMMDRMASLTHQGISFELIAFDRDTLVGVYSVR
ncbi:MAG: glycosyltransferase family 39 protein [candidate division WOR-3 bacterium]|nr:MAG: glycosyltransferase family 39 protein [candidate division WOR-3 bacterium]